ncbi:type IV toxin-antitoxin system AbiEi family antitoxin domain-containing protein [Streptomyces sp. NPDC058572]|uniref:type IV toxin-antitoxin system AbiEi family antitoxin domain-containing protein n=1 Tax=Streptomyces sp. NPDC058572 TaxID=3346546 RepID=UPI00365B2960
MRGTPASLPVREEGDLGGGNEDQTSSLYSVCNSQGVTNAVVHSYWRYYCCMERSEAIRRIAGIAADQWGLVTSVQAQAAGLSRMDLGRLVEADLLLRAARGVYQVAGGTPTSHLDIKVAWLRLYPDVFSWERHIGDERSGVVSHASACQLYDIGDIPADDVHISVPVRRTTRELGVTFHKIAVPPTDATVLDGLHVTTVDRTICDLLHARADAGHVGRVLADADQRGLTDTRELAPRVQRYTRAYGLPKGADGSDLLNSLAEQAGFTLRDQQITTAGERAAAAVTSALRPELVLEGLLTDHTSDAALPAADLRAVLQALAQQDPHADVRRSLTETHRLRSITEQTQAAPAQNSSRSYYADLQQLVASTGEQRRMHAVESLGRWFQERTAPSQQAVEAFLAAVQADPALRPALSRAALYAVLAAQALEQNEHPASAPADMTASQDETTATAAEGNREGN